MKTIDHDGFPTLIASILAASPEAALLVWRATSRQYRALVDAALLTHITLDVPRSPSGRRLSVSRTRPLRVRSASGHRIPALAWEDVDASPAQRERWASSLRQHTRVVDYVAEIAFPADDPRLASALDGVEMVRRLYVAQDILPWRIDCWRYSLPAHKVVDYVRLAPRARTVSTAESSLVMDRTDSSGSGATDTDPDAFPAVVLDMPPTVKSSVTVFRYDPVHAQESAYRWQFRDRSGRAPFVCVFVSDGDAESRQAASSGALLSSTSLTSPTSPTRGASMAFPSSSTMALGSPSAPQPSAPRRWTFLRPLIRALRTYAPSTRPVLVGITEIPRAALSLPPDMSDEDVKSGFLEILIAECLSWEDVSPARLRRITESITFLTHSEYADRVGYDVYALEVGGRVGAEKEGEGLDDWDVRDVLKCLAVQARGMADVGVCGVDRGPVEWVSF